MALCEQLGIVTEPDMTLHLASVILFQKFTQNIIHVPGKSVPQVILYLKDHLETEKFQELILLQANQLLRTECENINTGDCINDVYMSLIQQLQDGRFTALGNLKDMVIVQLQKQQSGKEEDEDAPNMEENIKKVKDIALSTKKSAQVTASED